MDENTKQNFDYVLRGINSSGGTVCVERPIKLTHQISFQVSWNNIRDAAMKMQQQEGVVRVLIDVAV